MCSRKERSKCGGQQEVMYLYGLQQLQRLYTFNLGCLLYVILPNFYGKTLITLFGATQHAGLKDIKDHRHSTRTVKLNPIFSFLLANGIYFKSCF